jgi:hypothetical protein
MSKMGDWTKEQAMVFFESGGSTDPSSVAAPALQGIFALPPLTLIDGSTKLEMSTLAGKPVFVMNVASR